MEAIDTASVVIAAAVVLLTATFYVLLDRWVFSPWLALKRLRAQGIPGYPFRPVVGNFPEIISLQAARDKDPDYAAKTMPMEFHFQGARKFGRVWTTSLGAMPWVVLNDPQLVRAALGTHAHSFLKIKLLNVVRILRNGIVLLEGETWHKQRRLLNSSFYTTELKRMYPLMVECTSEAADSWERLAKDANDKPLQMDKELCALTLKVICVTAFGARFTGLDQETLKRIQEAFERYVVGVEASFLGTLLFPLYPYLPVKKNRDLWRGEAFLRNTMKGIIAKRIQDNVVNGGADAQQSGKTDLLQLMIEATEGVDGSKAHKAVGTSERNGEAMDGHTEKKPSMSPEQLLAESLTFLFGGHETTSTMMAWTMILLSQHPEWQERAREEVLKFRGAKDKDWAPSFEEVSEMKLLNCILHETLRLYPPVAAPMRHCAADAALSDAVTVPRGCDIVIPVEVIHRSKDFWGEDADEFNPLRFADGVAKAATQPGSFLAFITGPRVCLGQHFALVEGKLILAVLLSRFKWRLADSYIHHPAAVFSVKPKFGLPVIMELL